MTNKTTITSTGLSVLGLFAGILAMFAFLAFYISGEEVGNYYYLGTFFTSLNVAMLCLCFGRVYDLLLQILETVENKS